MKSDRTAAVDGQTYRWKAAKTYTVLKKAAFTVENICTVAFMCKSFKQHNKDKQKNVLNIFVTAYFANKATKNILAFLFEANTARTSFGSKAQSTLLMYEPLGSLAWKSIIGLD